jgi:hypothetical protein
MDILLQANTFMSINEYVCLIARHLNSNYHLFIEKLAEGQQVEMFLGLADTDHSIAQLAKVHACIRELAKESGYTFDEMKTIIKRQSGLCYDGGDAEYCKSFAECSKDELALAIEACIAIGRDNWNINLS